MHKLRVQFEQWLRSSGAPPALVDDLGLAVYEALANAAEHAYPTHHPAPTVELTAHLNHSHITVTITDHGSWRHPGEPRYRGRGLGLIDQLVDTFRLRPSPTGTTVQLRTALGSRQAD